MTPDLELWDIVVVTYNSAQHLNSWNEVATDIRNRVICIDNSSYDASFEIATALFGRTEQAENNGLAASNNLGAALGSSPYILFVNPDVEVDRSGMGRFESIIHEVGGIVAPRLTDPTGLAQDNARSWPTVAAQVSNRISFRSRIRESYRWPVSPDHVGPVPWVLGAAIALSRVDFGHIGGWPSEFFLYYEDVELCMRAHDKGLPVTIDGTTKWVHHWMRESRTFLSRANVYHLKSALRFFSNRPRQLFQPHSSFAGGGS